MVLIASAQIKEVYHSSWSVLKLSRGMGDQAYRASVHTFQCTKSCVTAKPSQALQIHFRILHCQSQILFQSLLRVIYAHRVLHIPGCFEKLQLLTSLNQSIAMLWRTWPNMHFQCIKKPRSATKITLQEENTVGSVLLLGWETERITDGSCVAQWCVGGCLDTFECT